MITDLHEQKRATEELSSYQINVLSAGGLKIATKATHLLILMVPLCTKLNVIKIRHLLNGIMLL